MVVGTGAAVAIVLTGGAAAAAGAAVGVASGAVGGAAGTGTAVAAGAAMSTAGGAIAGAAATQTVVGAGIGAVAGGVSGTAVGTTGLAILSGPIGWIVLGAAGSVNEPHNITYDCWKSVVHETSMEPSSGMLLKDLIGHLKIASVRITGDGHSMDQLPDMFVTNVWDETFHIDYLRIIETNEIVCHARPLLAQSMHRIESTDFYTS